MRVLEVGAGNGYQASILASWKCQVVAIDVPDENIAPTSYYPVQTYDGRVLPFEASSFDCIFSSNVLEHIQPIEPFLLETRRVLKHDGMAAHVLPSPAWRFWTSLTHYPFLFQRALRRRARSGPDVAGHGKPLGDSVRRVGLKRVLFAGPHGEYPSAISELYYFSRARWVRLFERTGFEVASVSSNRLFYTGHGLMPRLSVDARRRLAWGLGGACNVFVLRLPSARVGASARSRSD